MNSTEIAADLEDIVTCLSRAEVWDRTSAERAIDRLLTAVRHEHGHRIAKALGELPSSVVGMVSRAEAKQLARDLSPEPS